MANSSGHNDSPCRCYASSPDFDEGGSNVKRRRKKIHKGNCSFSQTGHRSPNLNYPNSSPSIDLNRCVSGSQCPCLKSTTEKTGSPLSFCISFEINQIVEIGKQVGFQIDKGNSVLLNVLNGGGDNMASS